MKGLSTVNSLTTLVGPVFAFTTTVIGFLILRRSSRNLDRSFKRQLETVEIAIKRSFPVRLRSAADLTRPKGNLRTYYFMDDPVVLSLHSQLDSSDTVLTSREIEASTDGEARFSLSLKGLTPSWSRKSANKRKDTYQREVTTDRALAAVERHLIEHGLLSVIDISQAVDMAPLAALTDAVESIKNSTDFEVPEDILNQIRDAWRDRQRRLGRGLLAQLKGYVVIDADFEVIQTESGDVHLTAKVNFVDDTVTLRMICKQKGIREPGNMVLVHGTSIRAVCLGNIIRWVESESSLVLHAIAAF